MAIPAGEAVEVPAGALMGAPIRKPLSDPPLAVVNSFARNCMDCHQIFSTGRTGVTQPRHHTNIRMDHGMNVLCMNCHDAKDRDRLVLAGGKTIPYGDVARLCAQCHGPTYRDWQKGMHGKTMDFWQRSAGDPRRLGCTECHDPHAPAFDPMMPLPGPNTLRMGRPGHGQASGHGEENPLRRWSRSGSHHTTTSIETSEETH